MAILKLILIISILISVVKAIVWFNHRCDCRFGHTFFTLRAFCQAAVGVNFMWGGNYFFQVALRQHTPVSGALILFAAGIGFVLWMVYENVRLTGLIHGLAGSALQMMLFSTVAMLFVPGVLIVLFLRFVAAGQTHTVRIVDR